MTLGSLFDAINDTSIVSGLTHDFYRYPARFSPRFPRAAIELFTKPGDTVLDPFMGSSTTLVESLSLGRHAIGTDISELAVFLARVKTCLLNEHEIQALTEWAANIAPKLSPRVCVPQHNNWSGTAYQENLPWRFRKLVEQSLHGTRRLSERLQPVARCIVLKTLQWALDCKKRLPSSEDFRKRMVDDAANIAAGLNALRREITRLGAKPSIVETHCCSAEEITGLKSKLLRRRPPKLIVTSPPYPAVHVLYHRWQVLGRRETPAPFWIAECHDGQGASYYTFGDRRRQDHDKQYFERLTRCFAEIRKVVRDDCVVVQLVGFAHASQQLPSYLEAMSIAGFQEVSLGKAGRGVQRKRMWRTVPNGKWYTKIRRETAPTQEILLVHRAA